MFGMATVEIRHLPGLLGLLIAVSMYQGYIKFIPAATNCMVLTNIPQQK